MELDSCCEGYFKVRLVFETAYFLKINLLILSESMIKILPFHSF